jgi:hypothetical protein
MTDWQREDSAPPPAAGQVERGVDLDLVGLVRALEADHGPSGWPAVEMATLSGLADEVLRLRARVLELEALCAAAAASEQRWIDWLVAQGLLHYHPVCKRPDATLGRAWVLRRAYMVNGDSCEAWSADSAAGVLKAFLSATPGR